MLKRILVPCDFSAPSREGFRLAVDMASKVNGQVIAVYIIYNAALYDAPYINETGLAFEPQFFDDLENYAKKEFAELQQSVNCDNVSCHLKIEYGHVASTIKRLVEPLNIDLIVMGTTGVSGWEELLIGSNTEKVVRHSTVPVLSLRKAPEISNIKSILLPTLFSIKQDDFIKKLMELQAFFKANLHLLYINTPMHFKPDKIIKDKLISFIHHFGIEKYVFHLVNEYNEEKGIIEFAQDNNIDMVALGTHGRKGLAHLYYGSVAENVVNHIRCPIWTYHIKV
ncbi:universal stress protein [Echinicola jeungdonensis]|uniref:Universal stress protein n=1 Tax=Echinicola jeungdonensis TaxID=709343 RepID=A0ABV5J7G3_9BACT|nr:universal stress protein [Echinicola jeungdonensis]MDN3668092.1 universal stress protein [Echinicola jeungdonensis]